MSQTDLETWVVDWFASQLGVQASEVDRNRSFADFGLASSKLLMLVAELEDTHGIRIRPDDLFRHPTIAKLVAHCRQGSP